MPSRVLDGCRVLVMEDEYILAEDLRADLDYAGAVVLGPFGKLSQAMECITAEKNIDGAILDVNLGGEKVYPAADTLLERRVPVMFVTGCDASAIPPRFNDVARFEKPVDMAEVTKVMGKLVTR